MIHGVEKQNPKQSCRVEAMVGQAVKGFSETMRPLLACLMLVFPLAVGAQTPAHKPAKDADLKKKEVNLAPDKSLAGDVTRKKEKRDEAPTLKYDQFRLQVELQVAAKRKEQLADLTKIIELSQDQKEKPNLLFRLGELFWEESKYHSFEANRKDDEKLKALNADDKAAADRADAEKAQLLEQSRRYAQKAVEQYSRIVQEFKDYERTDEVLYFLGLNLMDMGDEKRGLVAYRRLIEKYQKSRYLPDAYLAVGEFYFNGSKGRKDQLEKALENYRNAARFTDNQVYGYALYKQGWCYFNLSDFEKAMDQFKAVVLFAEFAGTEEVEGKKGSKSNRTGLAKEARTDYVRAYSRGGGGPTEAREKFSRLAKTPDDLRTMLKQLASLFYDDGKDREAAVAYNSLIADRPLSPEAPGFQSRIVDCVMRSNQKQITVQQVRRLVKVMDDVLKGNPKLDEKDKKSLDEAADLAERTISRLAVDWHNEGKKTRDDQTFEFANAVYADYLTLFPQSAKAYDLRFFWAELLNDNLNRYDRAAEEYSRVFAQDIEKVEKGGEGAKPGKWMANAGYNAILAWTEVVKRAEAQGALKPPQGADPTQHLPIAPEKKNLLDACERYLKYVDKGERRVEIAYKVARIYYEHNYFDEAVRYYSEIALKYPDYKSEDGTRLAEFAANQVLDSYNFLGDWQKVNEWAKKFYAEDRLAVGKFREELKGIIEQSSFKLVAQLEAKKEFDKAGDAYLTFATEWPRSDLADRALFNAAVDFYNARALDRAMQVRKQLIQKHPRSPYVPQTMYALAEGYEAVADFDAAAELYEAYAAAYERGRAAAPGKRAPARPPKAGKDDAKKEPAEQVWEEARAQDALFNAGVFREGLGAVRQALKDREKYLELWPNSKDAEAVGKSILDLHQKLGAWPKVLKGIEDYERQYLRDPSKVLQAEGRLASIYDDKLKNPKAARGVYLRIADYFEKLPRRQREALDNQALDAVARASYVLNEDDWRRYQGLKLRWSTIQNPGELKATIKVKTDALVELQKAYTRTVGFKSADPAICALNRIGLAYDQMAEQLSNFPVPKGVPDDLLIELKPQFDQMAEPVRQKAAEAFASVVQKSQELDVFNACTAGALEKLRSRYAPERFPRMREELLPVELPGGGGPALGADLLTTLQVHRPVAPEKAAQLKEKTQDVSPRTASVEGPAIAPPPPARPDPTPSTPDPGPAGKKPSKRPAGAAPSRPKSPDAEPEDNL
jgi:cellulose synthase operon protein C